MSSDTCLHMQCKLIETTIISVSIFAIRAKKTFVPVPFSRTNKFLLLVMYIIMSYLGFTKYR